MSGSLTVNIYDDRLSMGADAANAVAEKIKALLGSKPGFVSIVFAAAPSQTEFLKFLSEDPGIEWGRIKAFHMDEYVGLSQTSPQSFAWFLKHAIFDKVPVDEVFYINGNSDNPLAECERYAALLKQYPPDIVCMGIGENTHIAFNDPYVANFNDPLWVKLVTLDEASRKQQVNDGCFAELRNVPTTAITLTVPALLQAESIYCIVPGESKASAVYYTVHSKVSEQFPSTSLKTHPGSILYLDKNSAAKL